ncbi:hypothetical protein ACTHGU_04850 [Chitinophagaceae bacterium MMS25-I14]
MLSFFAGAQMKLGTNPTNINPNAILEMESINKGMLLPRVALSATNSIAPMGAFITGMTVYNTATAGSGVTAVAPGIYYCDGTQWVKLIASAGTGTTIQRIQYTATQGQLNFTTPATITDINKIFFYRNGVLINCTMANANTVIAEVPCDANDDVKIVQQQ